MRIQNLIRQTTNNQPTGADLASVSITTGNRFMFTTSLVLNQNTTYALVLSNQGGSYRWSYSGNEWCYPQGLPLTSNDNGVTWSSDMVDFKFVIYDSASTPQPMPSPTQYLTPLPTYATPQPPYNDAITKRRVYVIVLPFGDWMNDPQQATYTLIDKIELGSQYHGYANPNAPPYLRFEPYMDKVFFADTLPPKLGNGNYDFQAIYQQYDICHLRETGAIDELWLWDGGYGGFPEWLTTGPEWSKTWGANAPSCAKQLTTMIFNYNRGLDVALESFNHRLEGVAT